MTSSNVFRFSDLKINDNVKIDPPTKHKNGYTILMLRSNTPDKRLFVQVDAKDPELGARIPPFVSNQEVIPKSITVDVDDADIGTACAGLEAAILQQMNLMKVNVGSDAAVKKNFNAPFKILSQGKIKDTETGQRWPSMLRAKVPITDNEANCKFEHTDGDEVHLTMARDLTTYNWSSMIIEIVGITVRRNGNWALIKQLRRMRLCHHNVEDLGANVDFIVSKKRKTE